MTAFINDTLMNARKQTRAEQAELIAELQKLIMPEESKLVFPGVFQTPGISGGVPCLGATRVPVFRVIKFLKEAIPETEIIAVFPSLSLYDVEVAKRYYTKFSEVIESSINEEE